MSRKLSFRRKRRINYNWINDIFSWIWKIALVCVLAFLIVWFWGKHVGNIGDSMFPEIENGNVVLQDSLIYHIKKPARGDVIIFHPSGDEKIHAYIKRIIGLPGETVEIKSGAIYINGEELKEDYETSALKDREDHGNKIKLKDDEYFVLGDNRLSSTDSRDEEIGNIKKDEIMGKAWFVISPWKNIGFIK